MPLTFVESKKGKLKLVYRNHFFHRDKCSDGKTHWRCTSARGNRCPARLTTSDGEIVKVWKEHNHLADAADVEATFIRDEIRKAAKTTTDSPQDILTNVVQGCSNAASARIPASDSLKRTIRHIRQLNKTTPALPKQPDEPPGIIFPDQYQVTLKGDQFLQFDSGTDENRLIILSTLSDLERLADSKHWYADGTFENVPLPFCQLYTVHGFIGSNFVPLVYVLLPNKSEVVYTKFLEQLKIMEPRINPSTITTDYEMKMFNAMKNEFPDAQLRGCFFHFTQCIVKQIQSNGLKERFETDVDFALAMRMLAALAFVPTPVLEESFEMLTSPNNAIFPEDAESVLDYFEDTWIGRPSRWGRRPPKYAHEMWNQYTAVQEDLPRTNNSIGEWHQAFEQQVSAHQSDILKFLELIQKEQGFNEFKMEKYASGLMYKKKTYQDADKCIKTITSTFFEIEENLIDYLRDIANNLIF